jgi:hypothetical protein
MWKYRNEKLSNENSYNEFEYTTFLTHGDVISGKLSEFSDKRNLQWKFIEKFHGNYIGTSFLKEGRKCFGVILGHCGLKRIENDRFLIWERGTTRIELFDTSDLVLIDNSPKVAIDLKTSQNKYFFNVNPIDSLEYYFEPLQTQIDFNFPDSFKTIDEIIQVNNIDNMYSDSENDYDNCALVILKPKENKIFLYPQDWYNKDLSFDHGYSWIPKADRNLITGKIHLSGVRIGRQLILDESHRQIEKNECTDS